MIERNSRVILINMVKSKSNHATKYNYNVIMTLNTLVSLVMRMDLKSRAIVLNLQANLLGVDSTRHAQMHAPDRKRAISFLLNYEKRGLNQ